MPPGLQGLTTKQCAGGTLSLGELSDRDTGYAAILAKIAVKLQIGAIIYLSCSL